MAGGFIAFAVVRDMRVNLDGLLQESDEAQGLGLRCQLCDRKVSSLLRLRSDVVNTFVS